jgi:ATP-dependent RNA helicase DeaD
MSQQQRDRVMNRLRSGNADLLLATDVAARGLDIDLLTHVVNYDVPSSPEAYVHRIGRVGRAGREGVAITLAQPREHRMLRTIEHITKQKIKIEKIPTVADLRARRLELTRAGLEESLLEDGDLDHFRVVVETLAESYDVMDVAAAAVKLAHEASGGPAPDEEEIPEVQPASDRGAKGRDDRSKRPAGKRENAGMTRIFIGAGRVAGIRPKDLVGAITNEAGLVGRDIGGIEIGDRFSLVEVPEGSVDGVITALRGTTIKGKKATIRRERFNTPQRR